MDEPLDPKLFELTCAAVKKGLEIVRKRIENEEYIGRYRNFPELDYHENGMPWLREAYEGPLDYKEVFDSGLFLLGRDKPEYKFEEEPEVKAVAAHLRDTPELWKHLWSATIRSEALPGAFNIEVRFFIMGLADRYMHVYNTSEFAESNLLPLYLPMEAERLLDVLPVNIWVPILMAKSTVEEFAVADGIYIRRISSEMHLARAGQKSYGLAVHDSVMGAATHAFVLTGYTVPNDGYGIWQNIANRANGFPLEVIDPLFSVLRLVTGLDTGYAQLLFEAVGWVESYRATLPFITGTSVRKYPAMFENFYWNEEGIAEISEESLRQVAGLFQQLQSITDKQSKNRLELAATRLNYCMLREDEADAILDATSALEVLLTPRDNSEINHKLATRFAALAKLWGAKESRYSIFKNVKAIYAHRSNVIHGNIDKLSKSKEINLDKAATVPTVKFAANYLRLALRALIENPKYLDSKCIDEELLLEPLGSDQQHNGASTL